MGTIQDGEAAYLKAIDPGPLPEVIRQHLNWIAWYVECADETNWRDMLDRIAHQIGVAQDDAVKSIKRGARP